MLPKRFAKIRVIQDNRRPIGLQQATLRSLLRVVDDILFLGAVLIALSQYAKALGRLGNDCDSSVGCGSDLSYF